MAENGQKVGAQSNPISASGQEPLQVTDLEDPPSGRFAKLWIGLIWLAAFLIANLLLINYVTIDRLIQLENGLREGYRQQPLLYLGLAFLIYTLVTGLSVPIATVLSLTYAWLFGWSAVLVINLAATCGATLAFLSARYLFRDWVERKFEVYLEPLNRGFIQEGVYYVLFLRMCAVFPFFLVNVVLGLVSIRWQTYFWSTMLGMLPLNFAFVYLGKQIPRLTELKEDGVSSLIDWRLMLGIAVVGTIPLLVRRLYVWSGKRNRI